ncbi:MAG: response regulator transcription factor [Sphingomonadales bacterium]|nr:response regulator transcription factor [Sphingomonadales bacterium]
MSIEDARILLVSSNHGPKSIIKTILMNMGFVNITLADSYETLEESLINYPPDMLVFDSDFSTDEVYKLVKRVRHNDLGINPFITVIALSNQPTEDVVEGVMQSGVDDLFIQPYSTGQFIGRITALIEARKPFVVTSDYIGPDRRTFERRGEGEVIPLINVPNALRACIDNKMNRDRFNLGVRAVAEEINIIRLERNSTQFTWLVQRILAGFSWADGHKLEPDIIEHLNRLSEVANETCARLFGTPFSHVTSICNALQQLAEKMISEDGNISAKDQELLSELANAFRIAFKEVDSDDIAKSIFVETQKAIGG